MRRGWELSISELTFNFTLTCRSPALTGNYYSDYQLFLYQTITEHREQGLTFHAIAEWMNKERYLTVRGRTFRGAHIHSILKKRLATEELLNREYPPVWSDFSMEVVDKTILMSDWSNQIFIIIIIVKFQMFCVRRGVWARVEAYLVTLDVTFSYSSKFHRIGRFPQIVI